MSTSQTDLFGHDIGKRCVDCKRWQTISAFRWNTGCDKRKRRDSLCSSCRNRRMREWWKEHGQTRARDRLFKRRFGITLVAYEAMLAEQGGACAICKKPPTNNIDPRTKKPRRLAIDHEHSTGRVRGLLCAACNRALGNFQDDPNLLLAAFRYLTSGDGDNAVTSS